MNRLILKNEQQTNENSYNHRFASQKQKTKDDRWDNDKKSYGSEKGSAIAESDGVIFDRLKEEVDKYSSFVRSRVT